MEGSRGKTAEVSGGWRDRSEGGEAQIGRDQARGDSGTFLDSQQGNDMIRQLAAVEKGKQSSEKRGD